MPPPQSIYDQRNDRQQADFNSLAIDTDYLKQSDLRGFEKDYDSLCSGVNDVQLRSSLIKDLETRINLVLVR